MTPTRARSLATVATIGVLVGSIGACTRSGQKSDLEATTPSFAVTWTSSRLTVGTVQADIAVTDRVSGDPVTDRTIRLSPTMVDMGHGAPSVVAAPTERPGRYRATASLFAMAGTWDIDIDIEARATDRETARFRVVVTAP